MLNSSRLVPIFGLITAGVLTFLFVASKFLNFAYLPDDGAYAYVAQRILAGGTLNGDVQDVHAGYINLFHASMMALLGESIASLRYPLLVVTVLQSCIVFWLLHRHSVLSAFCGAGVFATLTFVQFLNPSANWYCLFGAVVAIAILSFSSTRSVRNLVGLGFVIGVVFMTRQISGVILGIAILCYLHAEQSHKQTNTARSLLPFLSFLPLAVLAYYCWNSTQITEFVMFAIWPLAIGVIVILRSQMSATAYVRMLTSLIAGVVIAALPLIIFHISNHTVASWIDDTVISAFSLTRLPFIDGQAYHVTLIDAVTALFDGPIRAKLNAIFWASMILSPVLLGIYLVQRLLRLPQEKLPVFGFIASFFSLVSLHYQIPIYLFYTSALTLSAIALLCEPKSKRHFIVSGLLVYMCAIGAIFHAGKELGDVFYATRTADYQRCAITRLGINLPPEQCAKYQRLLSFIDQHASELDTVLALPVNPELNFLSRRPSPLRFFSSALGLRDESSVARAINLLEVAPPVLVYYSPNDKYTTAETRQLMNWVKQRYALIESYEEHEIYYLQGRQR